MKSAKVILKQNKIYFILFLLVLFIMLYSLCNELNIVHCTTNFIFNESFAKSFCEVNNSPCNVNNVFELWLYLISDNSQSFDSLVVWATSSFQILIPLFTSIIGVKIYYWYNTILKFESYRMKNYGKSLIVKITKESIKLSLSVFFAYLVFLLLCVLLARNNLAEYITREMYLDWFSDDFYINYRFFYFFMEGFARFFFVPFVYSFFAGGIAIVAKSLKQSIFIPLVYYFGLTLTISALSSFIGSNYFYFIPSTIMASSSYPNINTLMLFPVHIVPIIITILIIRYQFKLHEI